MSIKKDMRRPELGTSLLSFCNWYGSFLTNLVTVIPYKDTAKDKTEGGDVASTMSTTLPMVAMFTRNKHDDCLGINLAARAQVSLLELPTRPYLLANISAETTGFMSIENLKTFDPFAEADEDTGETKQSQNYIHIRIQQRNGRKTLTTVQGLPKKFDQKKILKVIKKKFACNGTIVNDTEMGEVIQLQGDQRKDVQEFLVDKKDGLELDAKTIKREARQDPNAIPEEKFPHDMGLFQGKILANSKAVPNVSSNLAGTLIMPTGSRKPSLFFSPSKRAKLEWGDVAAIEEMCCEGLKGQLEKQFVARSRKERVQWDVKYVGLSQVRVVSNRGSMLPRKNSALRQAVVRIRSQQNLLRSRVAENDGSQVLNNREGGRTMQEYFVLQRRIFDGVEGPWKVWGTTKETDIKHVVPQKQKAEILTAPQPL
ncbi:uncharacterized protein KY384_001092 [Bacidia gigantensis]|uniref:uncharacterized protein n=1 Tax=Bacidia gigantensis TaxID=2732470 RepID=UPI001D03D1A1|nr:uncharacterized protein KY384_001092 [Bacidia gigantensis]KAG8534248.1 hypothetical protein KY384_001092 [Bacidia gigantensis]